MKRYKTVEAYISGVDSWNEELILLREILHTTPLDECVKWGAPCYTHQNKNIVGLGAFKSYFGLWFFQGALLEDRHRVLINAQEGRTKSLRQWRFTSKQEIKPRIIKAYVKEAIRKLDQGMEIKPDRQKRLQIPPELQQALAENRQLERAFADMSRGRQREFAEYIASAKRADTKTKRLSKILPMISEGIGLNDKYRSH